MTYLITEPQIMAAAAADIDRIGWAIREINASAASSTTQLAAAAADEVSTATARLFGAYAQEYRATVNRAAEFQGQLSRALVATGAAYAESEAANAVSVSGTVAGLAASATPGPNYVTFVMGGSGLPIPPPFYVNAMVDKFVTPAFGSFISRFAQGLVTPEGFYPDTGLKVLPIDQSVAQGVTILDQAITQQLNAGNHVAVVGLSQSAIISSLEMQRLDPSGTPSTLPISFALTGDPMNPNGGLWERFAPLSFPSLGLTFYGATPANDFPTAIYTLEYDGAADFPRYPINVVADLNAMAGLYYVHGNYPFLTPTQIADATVLPTQGPTQTTYYMIPTQNLPILEPLRAVPVVGNPLADLLQPDMRVLVNLGYGDPAYGYSTSPANVPTPFGLFPHVNQQTVLADLVAGAQQGIQAAGSDVSTTGFPSPSSLSSFSNGLLSNPLAAAPTGILSVSSVDGFITALQAANTKFTNAVSSALASAYGTVQPTADIANALLTTIPAYDVNLFLDGISQAANGDPMGLINAVGYPIAADTGLGTFFAGLEFVVLLRAVQEIAGDFAGLVG